MTLAELADFITEKVGQTDEESVAVCKKFINARYQQLWDAAPWREALRMGRPVTDCTNGLVVSPEGIDRIMGVRVNDSLIQATELAVMMRYDSGLWEATGTPYQFATLSPTVCQVQTNFYWLTAPFSDVLAEASVMDGTVVVLKSEGASGTVQTITATMQTVNFGGTYVCTAGPIRGNIAAITKPVTVQPVTLQPQDPAGSPEQDVPYSLIMQPGDTTAPRLQRVQLLPRQTVAKEKVLLQGKGRFYGMVSDDDQASLRNSDNFLLAMGMGDMLERQRQFAKAQAKYQEGAAQLVILLDLEKNQSADGNRIIPEDIHGWGMGDFNFGSSGKGYW